jgi:hypothetical protein
MDPSAITAMVNAYGLICLTGFSTKGLKKGLKVYVIRSIYSYLS